jgi:hypothetical protein
MSNPPAKPKTPGAETPHAGNFIRSIVEHDLAAGTYAAFAAAWADAGTGGPAE